MTWIDDDMAERKRREQSLAQLQAREAEVNIKAGTIFENLWGEILARLDEAEEKDAGQVHTNGSPFERKLIVPQPQTPDQRPKEYTLALINRHQAISLKGADTNLIFPLDLGPDKVVRIKHDGEPKPIEEIARTILRQLVFPDMYGPK